MTQEEVNLFADATGDHQWIHVDPERAAAGPFGTTIAHGYLTLSLMPVLLSGVMQVDGVDDGRQLRDQQGSLHQSPVPVGSEIRAGATLASVEDIAGGVQVALDVVVEVQRRAQALVRRAGRLSLLPLSDDATRLPRGEEKTRAVRAMFDAIAPRYEMVNTLMTLGLDRALASARGGRPAPASRAAWCSTSPRAPATSRASSRARASAAVATDLSFGMLAAARDVGERVQADATRLPFRSGAFDGLTCGYALRNFTDLAATFDEMARVLRPGGRVSLLEVAEPRGRLCGVRAFASGSATSCPSSVACCRTVAPTPTCPARRPTCPTPRPSSRC